MRVIEREPGDIGRLEELVAAEKDADQRDRYRMALHAIRGFEAEQIADLLGSCRRVVQRWAYAYRDHGLEGLKARKPVNGRTRLDPGQMTAFYERVVAGPTGADRVCVLRGQDCRRLLREEFNADYSLNGVYKMLHRLNLSCLKPRPRHEKSDPAAMETFKTQSAPLL